MENVYVKDTKPKTIRKTKFWKEPNCQREASSRYRIQNVSARISELREAGFTIFTNRVKVKGGADRGRVVTAYRLHVESSDTSSLLKDFGV